MKQAGTKRYAHDLTELEQNGGNQPEAEERHGEGEIKKGCSMGSKSLNVGTSGVLLNCGVTMDSGNVQYISKARRKDLKCFHHREMINVGDRIDSP